MVKTSATAGSSVERELKLVAGRFADVDAIDLEVDTQEPDEVINCVRYLGPAFSGINPEDIKARLVEQVTGTVRWRECVLAMAGAGVTNLYELGCGKVLSGLARRIDKSLSGDPVGTPEDLDKIAAALKG